MKLTDIQNKIPAQLYDILSSSITELRPSQEKAIAAGLLEGKNLLICTPTASGKTLIAELAGVKRIIERKGKAVYIVPLKALANEKHRDFTLRYNKILKIALSSGDFDKSDTGLAEADIIITTSEKLDSLMRHTVPWIQQIATIIVDEIHLLNDNHRGPTLEILLTMLRQRTKAQIIGLSATIGNPQELAEWLQAELVLDDWRPVKLKKGIFVNGEIKFYD